MAMVEVDRMEVTAEAQAVAPPAVDVGQLMAPMVVMLLINLMEGL